MHSAELTLCGSAFVAADLVERYGADPDAVRVVPLRPRWPSATRRSRTGRRTCSPSAICAQEEPRPPGGAFTALRAGELPEHRLVLAGAGRPALRVRAPGVELTGWLDDAGLDALMRGADVLVHPSLYEGFGLVVVEAMARGGAVAAADATALPETAATRPSSSTRSTQTTSPPPCCARGRGATSWPPSAASVPRSSPGTRPPRRRRSSIASCSSPRSA